MFLALSVCHCLECSLRPPLVHFGISPPQYRYCSCLLVNGAPPPSRRPLPRQCTELFKAGAVIARNGLSRVGGAVVPLLPPATTVIHLMPRGTVPRTRPVQEGGGALSTRLLPAGLPRTSSVSRLPEAYFMHNAGFIGGIRPPPFYPADGREITRGFDDRAPCSCGIWVHAKPRRQIQKMLHSRTV